MGTKQTLEYLDWSGGLVDYNFKDRGDESFRATLQECYNWVHTNAGNLRLRPRLVEFFNAGWQTWTADDIKVFPIFADDRTYSSWLLFLRDDMDWLVKRIGADGDIDAVGTISTTISTGDPASLSVVQVADTVYVAGAGFIPRKITSANVLSTLSFYEQIPGTWVTAYKMEFLATFSGVFAEGDILSFRDSDTVAFSGRLLRAEIVRKGAATVKHELYITDVVGTVTDTFIGVVSANSDGAATGISAWAHDLVMYSHEGLADEYFDIGDTFRVSGVNYTTDDYDKYSVSLSSGHPFGAADGFTASALIATSPRPVAVGFYQNRLVYCGDVESALGGLLGVSAHYMRMWYSVIGDPLVIRPAGIGDLAPNGPIELDIFTGQSDRIQGMQCGNTIVVFGEQHEYVQTTQGPIGPAVENLPRFVIAGDNGSKSGSPAITYDGRILFAPATGGDVLRMEYNNDQDRHLPTSLAEMIQNRMDVPYAIASKPSTTDDGVRRVFVVTENGKIFVGTSVVNDRLSWSEIGLPGVGQTEGYRAVSVTVLNGEVYIIAKRNSDDAINFLRLYFADTGRYVLDLAQTDSVGNATTTWTLSSDWYSKRIFVIGTDSEGYEADIGFLDVDSAGALELPYACTSITYGFHPENYFVPARPTGSDEKGSGHLRPMKVMRVNVGVKDTTQLTIDGSPVFPTMPSISRQPMQERAFGAGRKMLVRWVRRPSVTIRAVAPWRATVLSASYEVVT